MPAQYAAKLAAVERRLETEERETGQSLTQGGLEEGRVESPTSRSSRPLASLRASRPLTLPPPSSWKPQVGSDSNQARGGRPGFCRGLVEGTTNDRSQGFEIKWFGQ